MPRNLSHAEIASFRDRLCDVAETLFADHGPEAVTIRQLAGSLGVSPMTPYRYFKDKEAILVAVRTRAFDRHAHALETAYAEGPSDPVERAAAIGAAYVRFALENPAAYKLMFDINQSIEVHPDLMRAAQRSRATMTAHLRDLADVGRLKGDPDLVGHMYWAALHGPLMLHLSDLLRGPDARVLIAALMAVLGKATIGAPGVAIVADGQQALAAGFAGDP